MIIDSDVLFMGPILDQLQSHDEDFVVVDETHPIEEIRRHYFDDRIIQRRSPSFKFRGYVFNTGQIVTTTGIFRREEFAHLVSFEEPRRALQPEVFFCGEQGLLNYLVLSKLQMGAISLKKKHFMRWAGGMIPDDVKVAKLRTRSPYDFVVHWAGSKSESLEEAPMSHLLAHFEAAYYRTIRENGLPRTLRNRISNLWKRLGERRNRSERP